MFGLVLPTSTAAAMITPAAVLPKPAATARRPSLPLYTVISLAQAENGEKEKNLKGLETYGK